MKKNITLLTLALLIHSARGYAQAGKLDTTFGVKGFVKNAYSAYGDFIKDMVIQPDGKTIIAGYIKGDTSPNKLSCFMARYKLNGSPDSSFGTKGVVTLAVNSSTITGIALGSNGKIVAIGNIHQSGNDYLGVYRFNTDGSLDTTFNHTGLDSILSVIPGNVTVSASGNIYIGAQDGTNYCVIKYWPDGTIDYLYGSSGSGYAYLPTIGTGMFTNDNNVSSLQLITLQTDQKVLYSVTPTPSSGTSEMGVIRLDSSGNLDTLFGNKGIARVRVDKFGDGGIMCGVESSGKIILAGTSSDSNSVATRLAMACFNSNGTLDTTFGNKGRVKTGMIIFSYLPTPVAFQSDGKIVLATTIMDTATTNGTAYGLTRYKSNGVLDSSFGKKGVDTTHLPVNVFLAAMKISPLQKTEAAGTARDVSLLTPPYAVTARYFTNVSTGTIDFAKNNNKLFAFPNPVHSNLMVNYTLANNETLRMDIYDLQGRMVKVLGNSTYQSAGDHRLSVSMDDLPSGNYIIVMTNTAGQHISLKIVKE